MTPEELLNAKEEFLSNAELEFKFTREEILQILGKTHQGFSKRKISDYRLLLSLARVKRNQEEMKDEHIDTKATIPCPICGKPTYGELNWYGKSTREGAWRCSVSGIKHFLWWKANQILRRQGKPIAYAEVNEKGDGVDYDLLWRIVSQMQGVETRYAYWTVRKVLLSKGVLRLSENEILAIALAEENNAE
jgi:hypothetical protein